MPWLQIEYILKGLALGLILLVALQISTVQRTDYTEPLLYSNGPALIGLGLALAGAAGLKFREGYRSRGSITVYLLFLLLECSSLIYLGILGGLAVALWNTNWKYQPALESFYLPVLAGSVGVGIAFSLLPRVQKRPVRLGVMLVAAGALAASVFLWFVRLDDPSFGFVRDDKLFAIQLLLGIPMFYLLTFVGQAEETEVEIGAICALLAVSLVLLTFPVPAYRSVGVLAPIVVYLWYTLQVLPWLRVLKHIVRGLGHSRVGRHRLALLAYRRALQLDPNNRLARDGYWAVHRALNMQELERDPQLRELVDLDLCLDRAGSLLIQGKPSAGQMAEARALLNLVVSQRPSMRPSVDYWEAVAYTHQRQIDQAVELLEHVLDQEYYGKTNPERTKVLLQAWQLGLMLHGDIRNRVGLVQLARPGQRMEAIAAVENHLAKDPGDPGVHDLKKFLYQDLTEAEYRAAREEYRAMVNEGGATLPPGPLFDPLLAQQAGLALVQDAERWRKGVEFLRMAADAEPELAPSLYVEAAKAFQRAGEEEEALRHFNLARHAGQRVGHKNLAEPEARAYFATVKYLGEVALFKGDIEPAIENFRLYTESPGSGLETFRTLAELYEKKGDPLAAARMTDIALQYNGKDPDLREKKDRYYYSILPEDLQARLETFRDGFDVSYCLQKARSILDSSNNDPEWLDVAHHLLQLVELIQPGNRSSRLLLARAKLRQGERDEAMRMLEQMCVPKPERFAGSDDEDSYMVGCQILGDLYMEVGKPDQAIPCYNEFRKSHRSGAKTMFKMGQAYEQLGDTVRAIKCYKQVTAFDGNPLVYEANSAIARLKV